VSADARSALPWHGCCASSTCPCSRASLWPRKAGLQLFPNSLYFTVNHTCSTMYKTTIVLDYFTCSSWVPVHHGVKTNNKIKTNNNQDPTRVQRRRPASHAGWCMEDGATLRFAWVFRLAWVSRPTLASPPSSCRISYPLVDVAHPSWGRIPC
jgi:hypothetical protein